MGTSTIICNKILVPLDGSLLAEHAIPYAAALAGDAGKLLLVEVVPHPQPVYGLLGNTIVEEDLLLRICLDGARSELESAARRWDKLAPAAEIDVAAGDPAEEILRIATERGSDMIVLASHGRGGLGRWTYGSVADRILRTADRPVLIVRPRKGPPAVVQPIIDRLVVPLDGSALAEGALPVSTAVAELLQVRLHLVFVLDTDGIAVAASSGVYPTDLLHSTDSVRAAATTYLLDQAKLLEAGGHQVSWEMREGAPANELLAVANPTDLVVMTTHGRGGVRRWLLGSVADKLVRHSHAPVLIARTFAT